MDERSVTINELAAMLRVTRRTIERAIQRGILVADFQTTKFARSRFDRARAVALEARADEARAKGHKQVLRIALANAPILRPRQQPPVTSRQWLERLLWRERMKRVRVPK